MVNAISIKTKLGWVSAYENNGKIFKIRFGKIKKQIPSNVLNKLNDISIIHHGSKNSIKDLKFALKKCDIIFHLAGINRHKNDSKFFRYSKWICDNERELDSKIKYFHFVWHLFVISGSILHYIVIFKHVIH